MIWAFLTRARAMIVPVLAAIAAATFFVLRAMNTRLEAKADKLEVKTRQLQQEVETHKRKEEAHEVRDRPVPDRKSDILDRM